MTWTVGRKITFGFSLSIIIVAALGGVSYRNSSILLRTTGWVAHSYEVRVQIDRVQSVLADAETGQRGYLLTGLDSYLEPYTAALQQVTAVLDSLRTLTADNAAQQQRIGTAQPLV